MKYRIVRVDKAIFIKKDTTFSNTIFLVKSKVGIACAYCNVYFENCKIVFYRCKKAQYCLFASNSNVKIKNCYFQNARIAIKIKNSTLTMHQSIVSYAKENALNAMVSRVNIKDCNIFANGENQYFLSAQLYLENTIITIKQSKISRCIDAIGLYAKDSIINLSNVDLFLNKANAIIIEHSKFSIKKSKIFDNTIFYPDSSVIYIENSKGSFKDCLINKSHSFSLYITKQSKVKILNSFIFDNYKGILVDRDSLVTIYKSRIFRNAIFLEESQISLIASKINIVSSKIFNGYKCISAQKISYIFSKNSQFSAIKEPVSLFELSRFTQK